MRWCLLLLALTACEPCPDRHPDCLAANDARMAQEKAWREEHEIRRHNWEMRNKMFRAMTRH